MVPIEDVPNAVTLYSAMVNISRIVGPAIAGLLIVTVGYGWCFTIDAHLLPHGAHRADDDAHGRAAARRGDAPRRSGRCAPGLKYIASVPELWITFAMLLIVGTISYNFTVVFPLFVEKGLHGSDAAYTLVYSAFSVGGLDRARWSSPGGRPSTSAPSRWARRRSAFRCSSWPRSPTSWSRSIVAVGVGAASVAYMTATTAIAQIRSDQEMIGRVLAIQTVLLIGTTPIGGPILGVISDAIGARSPVFIGGIAALAAAVFGLVAGRRAQAHITQIEERIYD